ncbi:hypothetical protein AYJ22_09665 [Ferroacidibacillus organovorans]|nr:hypothetical protein AYJ22_09665 [Ferroacidibacillus organovorans]
MTLNDASNLGNLIALSWLATQSGAIQAEWKANWKTILVGGVISPGGYLLFLLALHLAPVAQLAPMREIGTVFGTILGIVVLKEAQGRRRITAAGLITVGVILLGLFGLNLRKDDVMNQKAYDNETFFEGYKQLRATGSGLNDALEQPAIRSLLPALSGLEVLDLGCGMGQFAAYCADSAEKRIVGVDISEKMISYARAQNAGDNIEYIQMDIEEVQFQDNAFNLVVSSFVMHYVADYTGLLIEVYRWLRPGGSLSTYVSIRL